MAAPKLWNELPSDIRDLNSVNSFKTAIKTYLFRQAFYRVKLDAFFYLPVFIYLVLHLHLYFDIFVVG